MDWFFEAFFNFTFEYWQKKILLLAEDFIGLILSVSNDFWNHPVIETILDFSSWLNILVLVISLLFLLFDIVEEASSKHIEWGMIFSNLFKALVFCLTNRWLALMAMQLGENFVGYINFDKEISSLKADLEQILSMAVSGVMQHILLLLIVIFSGVFFVVAVRRFGSMLLHILTSSFYIADIVRGDTTKMGEWLRQMVAISCTFVFQYLMYYMGIVFIISGDLVLGISMWFCLTIVSKALQRFGYSTGTKGTMGSIGQLAGQGFTRLLRV